MQSSSRTIERRPIAIIPVAVTYSGSETFANLSSARCPTPSYLMNRPRGLNRQPASTEADCIGTAGKTNFVKILYIPEVRQI
jgi:hypothetical protein